MLCRHFFLCFIYVSGPRTDLLAKASRLDPCFTKFNDIYICKAAALKNAYLQRCLVIIFTGLSPLKTFLCFSKEEGSEFPSLLSL